MRHLRLADTGLIDGPNQDPDISKIVVSTRNLPVSGSRWIDRLQAHLDDILRRVSPGDGDVRADYVTAITTVMDSGPGAAGRGCIDQD